MYSVSSSSTSSRSSSVEPEEDDFPSPQASSQTGVLVPVESHFNASRSVPVPVQYNLRSSARLREKRKREEDETEKENVPVGEQLSDLDDTADPSQPGPSRPAKRRRVELNESEDESESEDDEEDNVDDQSDEESAADDDEEPTQGPATSPQKCLLGGCQYQLSDNFQQNWDHMLKPNHFNKNTDDLYPCTYPNCPGFDGVSGCKGKQALQRHVMSEHWRIKVWCTWPGCRNFYYRKDVLQKHMKRHTE